MLCLHIYVYDLLILLIQVTQETTIGNSNPELLTYISYKSVLEGFRSMVANRLASSGKEWAQIFQMFNSGTYVFHIVFHYLSY